ncbi:pilus assembly protein N-terminal domain-containing protein, partial [Rhizobium leguminosarum]|uniref:pilus assembly protein N-terminal domain-containing protein n=1 Tax=Rhizobium leguminosarum TaxID=384 RepID=UPI003F946101
MLLAVRRAGQNVALGLPVDAHRIALVDLHQDATVADAKTIVLTGRSFGTTNMVLLDADGNAIIDERIL